MNQEIDTLLPLKLNIDNASYTTVKDLDNAAHPIKSVAISTQIYQRYMIDFP